MADVGSFRQSGRARSVYVKGAILDGHGAAFGVAQLFARVSFDVAINSREFVAAGAVDPDLCGAFKVWHRGGKPIHELHSYDEVLGRGDIHAMRERGAGEVGIEQRNNTADPGDAEPDCHVLRPVGHD